MQYAVYSVLFVCCQFTEVSSKPLAVNMTRDVSVVQPGVDVASSGTSPNAEATRRDAHDDVKMQRNGGEDKLMMMGIRSIYAVHEPS